jgi:hypothetical protein
MGHSGEAQDKMNRNNTLNKKVGKDEITGLTTR